MRVREPMYKTRESDLIKIRNRSPLSNAITVFIDCLFWTEFLSLVKSLHSYWIKTSRAFSIFCPNLVPLAILEILNVTSLAIVEMH